MKINKYMKDKTAGKNVAVSCHFHTHSAWIDRNLLPKLARLGLQSKQAARLSSANRFKKLNH